MTKFEKGDLVKYELDTSKSEPRWNFGTDHGSSGVWETAEVIRVLGNSFITRSESVKAWEWVYTDSHQPGFPRLLKPQESYRLVDCGSHYELKKL
jgi:hypothetical protein